MRIRRCARWVVLVAVLSVQFACVAQQTQSPPLPVDTKAVTNEPSDPL